MLKGAAEGLQQERDRARLERDRLKQLIEKLAEQQTQVCVLVCVLVSRTMAKLEKFHFDQLERYYQRSQPCSY